MSGKENRVIHSMSKPELRTHLRVRCNALDRRLPLGNQARAQAGQTDFQTGRFWRLIPLVHCRGFRHYVVLCEGGVREMRLFRATANRTKKPVANGELRKFTDGFAPGGSRDRSSYDRR